jgi:hypothetical protein
MTYWASSASISFSTYRSEAGRGWRRPGRFSLATSAGQLALAGGILAVFPLDELAVLNHVLGDHRHGILTMVVEGDLADDGVALFHASQIGNDVLAVGTDLFNRIQDEVHGGEGEGAIGFRRAVVLLCDVFLHEELAPRQLLGRRTFAEGERAFGQRAETLDVGVRHDARGAVEHGLDAQLIHLRADAHPDGG